MSYDRHVFDRVEVEEIQEFQVFGQKCKFNPLVPNALHKLLAEMWKSVSKMTGFLSFQPAADVIRWQK